jgi:hypothetical protein
VGIQPFLDKIDIENEELIELLKRTFEKIKKDDDFIEVTAGGGKNSPGTLRKRIECVENGLKSVL